MPRDEPRSINALEAFGRALQGFGYGFRGQTPPFVFEDIERARGAREHERLGLERDRLSELKRLHDAQIGQIQGQVWKGTLDTIRDLQKLGLTPEQAEPLVERFHSTVFQPLFRQTPDRDADVRPLLRSVLTGGTSLEDVEAWYPRLLPSQRRSVLGLWRDDPGKGQGLAREFLAQREAETERTLVGKLQRGLDAGFGSAAPVDVRKAPGVYGLDEDEARLLLGMDPKRLAGFNIAVPIEIEAQRTEELAKRQGRGQAAGAREAAPESKFEISEGRIFQVFKDPTKRPRVVEDTRSLSPGEKTNLAARLLDDARSNVLAKFPRGVFGELSFGETSPTEVERQILEEHSRLLGQFNLQGVVKPSDVKPAPVVDEGAAIKELQAKIAQKKIAKASEAVAALVKAGMPEARARELVRQMLGGGGR